MERNATEATDTSAEKPVAVYRAFDIDGQLLYVGTSIDPDTRMKTHKHTSVWWLQHSWFDVQWFPGSREASVEEYRAIREEAPRFNRVGIKSAYFPHNAGRRNLPDICSSKAANKYLSVTEVAERTGLTLNTVKTYSQIPGRLPEPDAVVGRVKGWLPETIDAWRARRQG